MSARLIALFALLTFCFSPMTAPARAEDPKPADSKPGAKLKVLFISGGGWHDYSKLSPLLTTKISQLANIEFDIKQGSGDQSKLPEILKDPKLGEGYDAIVYDICYHASNDGKPEDYTNILDVTRNGKPAILLHCAMHCFRPDKTWAEFAGMRTNHHEQFGPFAAHSVDPASPITLSWPADWKTKGDELYVTEEVYPDTKPLLIAPSPREKDAKGEPRQNVVAWTHTYGKGKVFGTTLGHDTTTSDDPAYLQLVANGILWACDKLDNDGKPVAGYAAPGK